MCWKFNGFGFGFHSLFFHLDLTVAANMSIRTGECYTKLFSSLFLSYSFNPYVTLSAGALDEVQVMNE